MAFKITLSARGLQQIANIKAFFFFFLLNFIGNDLYYNVSSTLQHLLVGFTLKVRLSKKPVVCLTFFFLQL